MDRVRARLLQLPLEKNLCVDEQMIPFKGRLSIKQYIRGKPCPWGVKIFVICGQSGMPYDFIAYQGSSTELHEDKLTNLGFGASMVLQLAERIPSAARGHALYFDNYFTSYQLLEILREKRIIAAGTMRVSRFANPQFREDDAMRKDGRGSVDQ